MIEVSRSAGLYLIVTLLWMAVIFAFSNQANSGHITEAYFHAANVPGKLDLNKIKELLPLENDNNIKRELNQFKMKFISEKEALKYMTEEEYRNYMNSDFFMEYSLTEESFVEYYQIYCSSKPNTTF